MAAEKTPPLPMLLVCARCGASFEAQSLNVRFCSRKCCVAAEQELQVCPQCGRRFMQRGPGNYTYCSDACAAEAKRTKNREAYRKARAQEPEKPESVARCEWCGREYSRRSHLQRYCSDECTRAGRQAYVRDRCDAIIMAKRELAARKRRLDSEKRHDYVLRRVKEITSERRSARLAKMDEVPEKSGQVVFADCEFCGEPYDVADKEARNGCCSERCAKRLEDRKRMEADRLAREAALAAKRRPPLAECERCGNRVEAPEGKKPDKCPKCGWTDLRWLRRCHDCGQVTNGAYRCEKCALKWRRKQGVPDSAEGALDQYGVVI